MGDSTPEISFELATSPGHRVRTTIGDPKPGNKRKIEGDVMGVEQSRREPGSAKLVYMPFFALPDLQQGKGEADEKQHGRKKRVVSFPSTLWNIMYSIGFLFGV